MRILETFRPHFIVETKQQMRNGISNEPKGWIYKILERRYALF